MRIRYHMLSDKGGRNHNEDKVGALVLQDRACFVLADGLGGHGKGEVASDLAVGTVLRHFKNDYKQESFLEESLRKAQNRLLEEQYRQSLPNDIKTTIVNLQIESNKIRWGYSGDSRLYLFEGDRIVQRTLDHSVPQMLVLAKQLRESKIRFHEDRNRLIRVMGVKMDKPVYETGEWLPCYPNMRFLLCSDGFWEYVLEKEMQRLLKKSKSPQEWLISMQQLVLKRGKGKEQDNYSAIAVWMEA